MLVRSRDMSSGTRTSKRAACRSSTVNRYWNCAGAIARDPVTPTSGSFVSLGFSTIYRGDLQFAARRPMPCSSAGSEGRRR